jgi:diguanylate cyclase (GGDEF)-like protein
LTGDQARQGDRTVLQVGLVVGALSAVLFATLILPEDPFPDAPLRVSGVWLALAFLACELFAIRVERNQGESYGFTLALVPLAVGLVYAAPAAVVLARLGGVLVALAITRHRRAVELVYEVAVQAAQTVSALVVFRLVLGDATPVGIQGAFALLAGLFASYATSVGILAIVIWIVSRHWPGRRVMVLVARSGAVAGMLNAAIGVGLATTLWEHPHVALVVTAIVAGCLASNRIYTGLAERYRRLETHYEFVSSVVRSSDLDEIAASVLAAAKKLLRADGAVLLLRPGGDDEPARRIVLDHHGRTVTEVAGVDYAADMRAVMPDAVPCRVEMGPQSPAWLAELTQYYALVAPITGSDHSVVGALVVTQQRRKAVNPFGDDHASLLGSLADQASIAIENGMLFHRLEIEAAERAHQAMHDPLTGLPNRAMLTDMLDEALEGAYEARGRVGLIVVDVDSFSQVIDAFGHRSADGLLIQACSRIKGLLPENAGLARLGGEQFAVVMPGVADSDDVVAAARLLIAGFDPPFQTEGVLLALSVNIGIAVYPEQAIDVPSLVQRAHIAADTARRHRSGWEQYDPVNDPATPRRLALAADLREALEGDGLDVCFQPKVELATGIVRGAEALVRWNHPRLGRVRPDEFITIAEHTGDIRALTMVVMRKALAQCRNWRDVGLDMSVAVNLSARNLLDLHLVDDVAAVIAEAGIPPASLTLELTESVVMSESPRSVDVLHGLNELGVRLSCDDFGTGYSSLAHLRRLPIGEIKIDKSFIARMTVDDSDRAIARSVLALGRDLGLVTVAEGVESREGWDMLTALGCDQAQGFVVCPPLTSRQFGDWLDRRQPEEFARLDAADPVDLVDPPRVAAVDAGSVVIHLPDDPDPDPAPTTTDAPASAPEPNGKAHGNGKSSNGKASNGHPADEDDDGEDQGPGVTVEAPPA